MGTRNKVINNETKEDRDKKQKIKTKMLLKVINFQHDSDEKTFIKGQLWFIIGCQNLTDD